MPLKTNFIPLTLIKSTEVNSNFIIIRDQDVYQESLTSLINGVADEFPLTYNLKLGTSEVFIDGVKMILGVDYQELTPNKIKTTGVPNPDVLVVGQTLIVSYRRDL